MRGRGIDLRQVMAAFLTLSMFGMVGNTIKRDHFDTVQIAITVLVARELGASPVLPNSRGSKPGDEKFFGAEEFADRLNGVIEVARNPLALACSRKLAVVKVPYTVSRDYIRTHIKPFFKAEGSLRLETPLSSINMEKAEETKVLDPITCLAMFRTLQLQTEVRQLVDQMIGRLKTSGGESNGQFIAVDLRVEAAQSKSCQRSGSAEMKFCYHAEDLGEILRKTGVSTETPIYVTQSTWHKNLKPLTDIFPRTFTKEFLMPREKKDMFLSSASCELEKVIDFCLASESDVFVPTSANWFYVMVAGSRIASGRTWILVPTSTSSSSSSHISPYVSEKKHYAYSCFC